MLWKSLCKLGIHFWKYADVVYPTFIVFRIYRRCEWCGQWQYNYSPLGFYWANIKSPEQRNSPYKIKFIKSKILLVEK